MYLLDIHHATLMQRVWHKVFLDSSTGILYVAILTHSFQDVLSSHRSEYLGKSFLWDFFDSKGKLKERKVNKKTAGTGSKLRHMSLGFCQWTSQFVRQARSLVKFACGKVGCTIYCLLLGEGNEPGSAVSPRRAPKLLPYKHFPLFSPMLSKQLHTKERPLWAPFQCPVGNIITWDTCGHVQWSVVCVRAASISLVSYSVRFM